MLRWAEANKYQLPPNGKSHKTKLIIEFVFAAHGALKLHYCMT
jgi:hypothetical protein